MYYVLSTVLAAGLGKKRKDHSQSRQEERHHSTTWYNNTPNVGINVGIKCFGNKGGHN